MAKAANFDPLSKGVPTNIRKFTGEKEENGNNFALPGPAKTKFEH